EWRRSHRDVRVDLCHMFLSAGAAQLVAALLLSILAMASARLSSALGVGLWPVSLPLGVQVVIALLVAELGYYWLHRLMHGSALWRVHAIHHSAPRLYWLNSYRNHPGEFVLALLFMMGPLVLLGAGEQVLSLFTVVAFAIMLLQHSNIA